MNGQKRAIAAATLLACLGMVAVAGAQPAGPEWKDWGGDAARTHFSTLNQINAANVASLRPAWVWSAGTYGRSWEIRPLMVHGLLIISEPGTSDVGDAQVEIGEPTAAGVIPVTITA